MTHRVSVPVLTRVEGGGGLYVSAGPGGVPRVRLEIFEPPRFFEALLVGRPFSDVLDITARICGICPVAYQMTAAHALEELFGVEPPEGTRELRRLLYCGEWIQSHMLHVHLLAAPDYLGYADALAMTGPDREALDRGLRLRRLGSDLMATIGGRAVHPVSPVVGGFAAAPPPARLHALRPRLEAAAGEILEVADWVAGFDLPALPREAELVALVHPGEYPMNEGALASSAGRSFAGGYEAAVQEVDVAWSTARHGRAGGGGLLAAGPLARLNLNAAQLTPLAREAARRAGLVLPETDPFRSLAARVVETALAFDEARRLIDGYRPPVPSRAPVTPRAGTARWVTEAPRGILFHRYDVDGQGIVRAARIVPPTSINLPRMEDDVRLLLRGRLDGPDDQVTRLGEMAVRNHDPCISCATHFLRLHREGGPGAGTR